MNDRHHSLAEELSAACLQHVVGDDGRNCRNCGISAAWIEERNRRRDSSYRVPGAHPRVGYPIDGSPCVWLSMQRLPDWNDWIEVVW